MELYDKRYVYFDWDDRLNDKNVFVANTIDWIKSKVNECVDLTVKIKKSKNPSEPFKLKYNNNTFVFAYYDPFYEMKKAYLEGETLEYKHPNDNDIGWLVYNENHMPHFDTHDGLYEWRVKSKFDFDDIVDYSNYQPTEPIYYLSVNKNGYLEFTISQNITKDTIYNGTRKECERMMKIIGNEFEEEDISYRDISYRLRCIINKYSHEKYKRRMTNREFSEWLAKGNGEFKSVGYLINTSTSYFYQDGAENENVDNNIFIRDFGSDEWRQPLIEV